MSRTGIEDKPAWRAVPASVRAAAERVLGASVRRAERAYGGYGPSATFRLALDDGRRAFFKGVYPLPEGSGVRWTLSEEDKAYARLGRWMRPWAPELHGVVRADGWHALLLEDVGGQSVLPWTASKVRRAARSYAEFHRGTYGRRLPPWLPRDQHHAFGRFWRVLARERGGLDRVAALAGARADVAHAWLEGALADLIKGERALARVREPFVLMHFDTRSDNVRLDGDLLRMFDWPFAAVGPHEFELAAFAQSIASEGGPAPEEVVDLYADVLPVRVPALRASVTGIAGYFADRASRPPLAGLPRLRSVQRKQLKASLPWAARLLGLREPAWIDAVPDGDDATQPLT